MVKRGRGRRDERRGGKRIKKNERKRKEKRKRCSRFSMCVCAHADVLHVSAVSYIDLDINSTEMCEYILKKKETR